jgi:hypothetical protein
MRVMNIEGLRQKLLAVARAHQPADRVPYAFEKRILARLSGRPVTDRWAEWALPLWRGAATCVLAMSLFSAISLYHSHNAAIARNGSEEISPDFEQTMLAAVDQPPEAE